MHPILELNKLFGIFYWDSKPCYHGNCDVVLIECGMQTTLNDKYSHKCFQQPQIKSNQIYETHAVVPI